MSAPARPSISVVIETVNAETGPRTDLGEVLAGLAKQTYPKERIEILVVVEQGNRAIRDPLYEHHPNVRVVETANLTYYGMKTAGIERATGDVIALLDSDTVPAPVWAERIANRIETGADVVAGKTRYRSGAALARTFDFFNFGYIQGDENGRANGFLPNNVAFRRNVILEHKFDPRILRSGGAHLLGHKLMALGYRLVYEPEQRVIHNFYGILPELRMRVKSGYDCVNLSRLDPERFLTESAYLQRSSFALAIVYARRIVFDARAAIGNRRDLDISLVQIPYFFLISPLVRGLELIAALITMVKPEYFAEKYGW